MKPVGYHTRHPFVSPLNFLGQQFDKDGNPNGPKEFENIVKERYYISKRTHTSYSDIGDMSVLERKLLLKYIAEEIEQEQRLMEEHQSRVKSKR